VVCQWSHLALHTVPDGHDVLPVGVVRFLLIIVIVVGHDCNPPVALLLPLHVALGLLFGSLDGNAGWCHSAATGDGFPAAWDKERLSHLFVGGDVEKLLGGVLDDIV
jgi:hypothetical protein